MGDNKILYFLLGLVLFFSYRLYVQDQENIRLYKICKDQDDTIQLQLEAINYQQLYINRLKSYYNNSLIYDNDNSYNQFFDQPQGNPIH